MSNANQIQRDDNALAVKQNEHIAALKKAIFSSLDEDSQDALVIDTLGIRHVKAITMVAYVKQNFCRVTAAGIQEAKAKLLIPFIEGQAGGMRKIIHRSPHKWPLENSFHD
jgi:hypothetical protein